MSLARARDDTQPGFLDAQAQLRAWLGPDRLTALHRTNLGLDLLGLAVPLAGFAALMIVTASADHLLVLAAAIIAQGFILQWFGLINHEYFVHRRFGRRAAPWLALVYTLPLFLSFTRYADAHAAHHRFIGAESDGEAYKQDIRGRLRRLAFCTYAGVSWAASGRMGPGRPAYFALRKPTPATVRQARRESGLQLVFVMGVIALAVAAPRPVLLGYVAPLLIVLPALNALRILYEHAELDPANPFYVASRFRCGWFEAVAYAWDAGEYHLIHHFLPHVPFYRMPAARRTLDPFFDQQGVTQTTGRLRLLKAWFVDLRAHRSWWSLPLQGARRDA